MRELTQQCVGGHDLHQQRQKIQALSEETNQYLKKNVFRNYMQFIETAKEISCKLVSLSFKTSLRLNLNYCTDLESEMYQLSHLLSEQRSLLIALLENSILGDKAPGLKGIEVKSDMKSKFNSPEALNLTGNFQAGRNRLTALLEKVEGCTVSYSLKLINLKISNIKHYTFNRKLLSVLQDL